MFACSHSCLPTKNHSEPMKCSVWLLPCDLQRARGAFYVYYVHVHESSADIPACCYCVISGQPQVKLWSAASGFCFATFSKHEAPVAAITFVPGRGAMLSASLRLVNVHTLLTSCFVTLDDYGYVLVKLWSAASGSAMQPSAGTRRLLPLLHSIHAQT